MKIMTKAFGEAEINKEKIIRFENGLIGFPEMKDYVLLFDEEGEQEEKPAILWLQSTQEPALALPVMNPLMVIEEYQPSMQPELLENIGDMESDGILILSVITVPSEIEKMTMNLKAPIIINPATQKACQIIADNPELQIKYPVYELLKSQREKATA